MGEIALTASRAPRSMARPLIGMLALLAAVIAVAVAIGATHVSWRAFIDGDAIARAIILRIRLPRVTG